MFTGIIEEIGKLNRVQRSGLSQRVQISAKKILEDIHIGDSIAVNGVCLTVTKFSATEFAADIMPETVQRTTFAIAKPGDLVNLERALRYQDRVNGHFVAGHIDGIGKLRKIIRRQELFELEITANQNILASIVPKGSVAIDGISLTVINVLRQGFTIGLIPLTAEQTTLGKKSVGSMVNIETDMLAKYIQKNAQISAR
ncbi:MAG: riboflavin synthase [bacterium]